MSKPFTKGSPSAPRAQFPSFQLATDEESGELETVYDEAPDSRGDLLATIQEQIVPRLMLAHASAAGLATACVDERMPPTAEEIAEFARIATTADLQAALAYVERLGSEGLTFETLLLDLIGQASAKLGADWQDDRRSFTEVTVGLGTLQQVVNVLGPSQPEVGAAQRGFVVLAAAPGEQHTLGLYLLGEFLRRSGWAVHVAPTITEAELVALVSTDKVDMVGFSVSGATALKALGRTIASVRRATKNPSTLIMVGGGLELSSFASRVGATYCADAREAVRWLDHHGNVADSGQRC